MYADPHNKVMGNGDWRNDAGEVLGNLFDTYLTSNF
jgi:hypothetical protein